MAEEFKPAPPAPASDAATQQVPPAASAAPAAAPGAVPVASATEGEAAAAPKMTAAEAAQKAKARIHKLIPKRGKGGIWAIPEVIEETGSEDRPTRRMANVFVLGLVGIVTLGVVTVLYVLRQRKHPVHREWTTLAEQGDELKRMMEHSALEAARVASLINLGSFIITLKPGPEGQAARHVQDLADVEFTLACDTPETRAYIEANGDQFKDQINQALIGIDRGMILTRDGKKQLKKMLMKKLNDALPEGKVVDIFFTKLLVS